MAQMHLDFNDESCKSGGDVRFLFNTQYIAVCNLFNETKNRKQCFFFGDSLSTIEIDCSMLIHSHYQEKKKNNAAKAMKYLY